MTLRVQNSTDALIQLHFTSVESVKSPVWGLAEKSLSVIHVFYFSFGCFFFLSTVKPTVVDVDIFVNSIGPVSSINMVSPPFHPPRLLCDHA